MQQVKIEIFDSNNSYKGDLDITDHENFPLAITKAIADFKDITKRKGSYSKSFKILATKNNNHVLDFIYNVNIDANDTVYGSRARVMVNGLPTFEGIIQVNNVTQSNNLEEYDLQLTGDNLDWVQQFRELSIRDLDYNGPNVINGEVPYTKADIEASWIGNSSNWDYVYSLKNFGAWRISNSNGDSYVKVEDMRPDVYLRNILYKAFQKIGYTLDSNFINDTSGIKFSKLIMPVPGNGFNKSESWVEDKLFRVKQGLNKQIRYDSYKPTTKTFNPDFTIDSGNDFYNNGGHFKLTSDSYSVPVAMKCKFILEGELYFYKPTRVTGIEAEIYNARNNQTLGFQGIYGNNVQVDNNINIDTGYHLLLPNDEIKVKVKYSIKKKRGQKKNKVTDATFYDFILENDVLPTVLENDNYFLNSILPDIKLVDIISGLTNMFNLYFQSDIITKTVKCEPRKDFLINDITQATDWSDKLDISKTITIEFLDSYKRNLQFKYKNDSKDKYLDELNKTNGTYEASLKHQLPDRFKKGIQKFDNKLFSYTCFIEDASIAGDLAHIPVIPRFWDSTVESTEPSYDFAPRILYYAGYGEHYFDGSTRKYWRWYNTGNPGLKEYPYATEFDTNMLLDYGLDGGLVDTYYLPDIAIIKDGKQITAWFNLTPTDMLTIDLRKPIYVNHHNLKGYYHINKIADYQPTKRQSTKVELIRLLGYNETIDLTNRIEITSK